MSYVLAPSEGDPNRYGYKYAAATTGDARYGAGVHARVYRIRRLTEPFKWSIVDCSGAAEEKAKHASSSFGGAGSFGWLLKGTAGADVPRHHNLITTLQLSSALPTSHICDFSSQRRSRDGRRMSLA